MLKPEECIPGTAVICYRIEGQTSGPPLEINSEYTIDTFFPEDPDIDLTYKGISLEEFPLSETQEHYVFPLEFFRLKQIPQIKEVLREEKVPELV